LAWLKYFTYQLVPVLAPKYKQHVLPPAEVRKEIYVKSVYFIRVKGAWSS
jgi:hypothetical protein